MFEEPVRTSDFPEYLAIVGGEENMMDLGTMQSKVDEGEYRSIDDIEVSCRYTRYTVFGQEPMLTRRWT